MRVEIYLYLKKITTVAKQIFTKRRYSKIYAQLH